MIKDAIEDPEVVELLSNFDFENPFDNFHTLKNQIKALKNNCSALSPLHWAHRGLSWLSYVLENVSDSETGTYIPKLVLETCQYAPVIDTLKLISNTDVRKAVFFEQPSENDILAL